MKTRIFTMIICSLLASEVNAQSFLEKLGKEIGETVKKEITKGIRKEIGKKTGQKNQNTTPHPDTGYTTPEQERAYEEARLKSLPFDEGDNITREEGTDYIDEYGINHGGGILIDGVVWAPVNCGYHQTDYPYGKLYQWGRKLGQGYGAPYADESDTHADKTTVDIVPAPVTPAEARKEANKDKFYVVSDESSFNWTRNDCLMWNTNDVDMQRIIKSMENDPCPEGWRVAHDREYAKLLQNHSLWVKNAEGQTGYWFSGSNEYNLEVPRIFLPAAGDRFFTGAARLRSTDGNYWSCHHHGSEWSVGYLHFDEREVYNATDGHPVMGMTVRCVRE